MRRSRRLMIGAVLGAVAVTVSACAGSSDEASPPDPARVEHVKGTEPDRVILTESSAQRLGIETTSVREAVADINGSSQTLIPYAAVLYDPNGDTFVYTNPSGRTFVRARITVERIDGDLAVVTEGPASGTAVVTVGAPELLGIERGVGE
jgi:hypothetical protein